MVVFWWFSTVCCCQEWGWTLLSFLSVVWRKVLHVPCVVSYPSLLSVSLTLIWPPPSQSVCLSPPDTFLVPRTLRTRTSIYCASEEEREAAGQVTKHTSSGTTSWCPKLIFCFVYSSSLANNNDHFFGLSEEEKERMSICVPGVEGVEFLSSCCFPRVSLFRRYSWLLPPTTIKFL